MRIMTFPRDSNPYQDLLHAALAGEGIEASYLPMPTPSRSLNILLIPWMLVWARLRGVRILHLHWVFGLAFPGSATRTSLARLSQAWFMLILFCCRTFGLRVVWTAHNVLPHDRVFADDRAARGALIRASSHVIVHDEQVTAALAALAGGIHRLPRLSVVPHGSYVGHYTDQGETAVARERLVLPTGRRVLLFVGRVTADKGVEDLVQAFASRRVLTGSTRRRNDDPPLLVIAGRCSDRALAQRLDVGMRRLGGDAWLDLRHLPDNDLSDYLSAADVVILPFRQVTTSGSALLAMAFAKPVVVPDLDALSTLPATACLRYAASDREALRDAVTAVCEASTESLERMGGAGRAWTSSMTWPAAASSTARAYRDALRRQEPR
jgi:glycosyltransferase involved in cell wall biosynthesis